MWEQMWKRVRHNDSMKKKGSQMMEKEVDDEEKGNKGTRGHWNVKNNIASMSYYVISINNILLWAHFALYTLSYISFLIQMQDF